MFDSARMKVRRAQGHIDDLKFAFDRFIETHPHTFVFDTDTETNTRSVEVRFGEAIPPEFSLILGDAIHNLRTSLDHAAWELIGIDSGTQDRFTPFRSVEPRSNTKPRVMQYKHRVTIRRNSLSLSQHTKVGLARNCTLFIDSI
jgi:hypothetical protein